MDFVNTEMMSKKFRLYKLIIALLIISGFIYLAIPPQNLGVWYHDSGKYHQQGFDIFGNWPPVYPVLLRAIGRGIVYPQAVLAVVSWCFMGYIIAGFPGLFLGGILAICPWFARWNGLCLTESVSHSLAALGIAFSVLLTRSGKWVIPWIVVLLLFTFTRVSNVFIIPFFMWPIFHCRWKVKGAMIISMIVIIAIAYFANHDFQKARYNIPGASESLQILQEPEKYSLAMRWLLYNGSRPYFLGKPITGIYDHYMPRLSKYSNYLAWLQLPRYSWFWLLLICLPIIELIKCKKLSVYSILIIMLFLASYVQCMANAIYYSVQIKCEVWRHLATCDCFFCFSLIATLKIISTRCQIFRARVYNHGGSK